jgi:hypothetical protein
LATRRWFLATATTCSATSLFSDLLWAATPPSADKLTAWTELLTHKQAAARIGKVLSETTSAGTLNDLMNRQRARFQIAAMPSLSLLQDMMAEDYVHDRTVTARRVVFSEAEAALFLTCYALDTATTRNDG